ncbi:MAG: TIGR03792 family protein [Synechococcus sp. SB0668_bin_13]|uniref:TIGR03792 family protein n=1 Tax=Synechococcus sp. SB0676_bin_10 TaxID=2604869 RepID=A0A6B1F950_9SYNE|nr:TIGR03792 family protein [Synechococcus sp. SB0668_bin_13]MYG37744.1 TIGR03792 family protein [Synechococcus sp. SB0676_bin_10]MYG63677.1 TIGR03792 family protein [Synechococcus sp. SB0675_bin_7]MYK07952.1 TIGR03792 family protein [Synechococcus sp. SB0670_bin_20]MYK86151.1 TIGR03792 family protein [Synechococcus sp. SB0669_bin_7]
MQLVLARTVLQCNLEKTMFSRFGALLACCLAGLLVLFPWRVSATPSTPAADRPARQEIVTVEMLRLAVPVALRDAWFNAEAEVWKPWLEQQPAYLGRDLHWDPQQEQAQVLIRWRSQQEWEAISEEEVAAVQARFVATLNKATGGEDRDPIPLLAASRWLLLARDVPKGG